MAVSHLQQDQLRKLTEERFFSFRLGETGSLIKEALEEAAGMELEELAPGMWAGSRETSWGMSIEVTARAQAVEDGTSVELRVEHRSSPGAIALAISLVLVAGMLVLPLIPLIMYSQKAQKRQQRERLVLMHKMWTELGAVVGAPRKASYRDAPKRAYAAAGGARVAAPSGARIDTARRQPADRPTTAAETDAAVAEAEAAEAEAADAAARAGRA